MNKPSRLIDEIQQTRPFRSPAEEATLGIVRTASLIRRAVAKVVERAGITPAMYNVLGILGGAGGNGLPTLVVRDRLVEEAPGITRLIDKLELSGLVRRDRSTPDRRQVICYITPAGLALLKKLDPIIVEGDETGGAGLTVAEQKTLVRLLDKVRGTLRG